MTVKTDDLASFQNQISQSILNKSIPSDAFVIVKLEDDEWLIDMQSLVETAVPPRVAKNAAAPSWVLGIANFKGRVWTILDTQQLLYGRALSNPRWAWVTLLRTQSDTSAPKSDKNSLEDHKNYRLGLLWTEVVEIATKERYDIQPEVTTRSQHDLGAPIENGHSQQEIANDTWCRARYKDSEGKIWKELNVEKMLSDRGIMSLWRQHMEGDAIETLSSSGV